MRKFDKNIFLFSLFLFFIYFFFAEIFLFRIYLLKCTMWWCWHIAFDFISSLFEEKKDRYIWFSFVCMLLECWFTCTTLVCFEIGYGSVCSWNDPFGFVFLKKKDCFLIFIWWLIYMDHNSLVSRHYLIDLTKQIHSIFWEEHISYTHTHTQMVNSEMITVC